MPSQSPTGPTDHGEPPLYREVGDDEGRTHQSMLATRIASCSDEGIPLRWRLRGQVARGQLRCCMFIVQHRKSLLALAQPLSPSPDELPRIMASLPCDSVVERSGREARGVWALALLSCEVQALAEVRRDAEFFSDRERNKSEVGCVGNRHVVHRKELARKRPREGVEIAASKGVEPEMDGAAIAASAA